MADIIANTVESFLSRLSRGSLPQVCLVQGDLVLAEPAAQRIAQTLAQAVELGVPFVYTDNDAENAPMLHINERLGYRSRPGLVGHIKRVEKKGDA